MLKLPYHIVSIVVNALIDAAAKKYDLEAWFSASKTYKELVSYSNCIDYQSRKLEIRYGQKKSNDQTKQYCHLLNTTLTATKRTLCCNIENYMRQDGVVVHEMLQPFMGGQTLFILMPDLLKNNKWKEIKVVVLYVLDRNKFLINLYGFLR
ncbi:hypothetical protein LXL04_003842 [Taraxacum kok-saghyz]